jgi:hypothetical protein
MKSSFWLLFACVLIIPLSAEKAAAQCSVSYQPDFSVYTNESTSDGSHIYAEVEIDGSGEMTESGTCTGLPTIEHTPYTSTSLNGSSSGWVSGGQYCPDCYFSVNNAQDVLCDHGVDYEFDWAVQVNCNVGGTFFATNGFVSVRIAVTTYKISTVNANGTVTFVQACPGTSKPTCGAAILLGREPANWAEEFQLYVRVGGTPGGTCLPLSIVQYRDGPPAPYPCT